jgi:hypothetical protein
MKKSYNISPLIYSFIIFISFAIVGCDNNPQFAQAKIDRMASDFKSQLPIMLDSDTKLVNVYTKKLELVSEYELLNYAPNDTDKAKMENNIESYLKLKICPSIKKELLSKGISSRYIYKGKDGQPVVDMLLSPGDC